jgi:hypothetical protein
VDQFLCRHCLKYRHFSSSIVHIQPEIWAALMCNITVA